MDKFQITQYLFLETKVINLKKNFEKNIYEVTYKKNGENQAEETKEFNFAVVATGRYNKHFIPENIGK